MDKEIVEINCQDGTDSRCLKVIEIEVDFDEIMDNKDYADYAERTGQDIVCCYCGSDQDLVDDGEVEPL